MKTFKNDYSFGKIQEDSVYQIIKEYFIDDNIIKKKERYSTYDFEGDNYIYELKSRLCLNNTFASTIIPVDKVKKNILKKQIFLFNFRNGLYYIEYNEQHFLKYKQEMYKRETRLDYNDKKSLYFFIDIGDLIKIDLKNN